MAQCILGLNDLFLQLENQVDALTEEVQSLKGSSSQPQQSMPPIVATVPSAPIARRWVLEPSEIFGERKANILENFLWDMEFYFDAAHIPTQDRVSTYAAYLMGDAKLWWGTQMAPSVGVGRVLLCLGRS